MTNTLFLMGMPGGYEWLMIGLPILVITFFWVRTIIDIAQSDFFNPSTRVMWLLFVLFIPLMGMIFYYIFGRKQKVSNQD